MPRWLSSRRADEALFFCREHAVFHALRACRRFPHQRRRAPTPTMRQPPTHAVRQAEAHIHARACPFNISAPDGSWQSMRRRQTARGQADGSPLFPCGGSPTSRRRQIGAYRNRRRGFDTHHIRNLHFGNLDIATEVRCTLIYSSFVSGLSCSIFTFTFSMRWRSTAITRKRQRPYSISSFSCGKSCFMLSSSPAMVSASSSTSQTHRRQAP